MLHTRLCDLFGIDHPVVGAQMGDDWAGAALAVAVSAAGGPGRLRTCDSPTHRLAD